MAKKEHVVATILREEENRRTIARLRKQLKDLLVSKETDILQKNEEIALLKDQRQEAKARTTMENKYIKKDAVVRVEMSQKKTERDQNSIRAEIAALRAKMEEEAAVHEEIVQFLKGAHVKLADKVCRVLCTGPVYRAPISSLTRLCLWMYEFLRCRLLFFCHSSGARILSFWGVCSKRSGAKSLPMTPRRRTKSWRR